MRNNKNENMSSTRLKILDKIKNPRELVKNSFSISNEMKNSSIIKDKSVSNRIKLENSCDLIDDKKKPTHNMGR